MSKNRPEATNTARLLCRPSDFLYIRTQCSSPIYLQETTTRAVPTTGASECKGQLLLQSWLGFSYDNFSDSVAAEGIA